MDSAMRISRGGKTMLRKDVVTESHSVTVYVDENGRTVGVIYTVPTGQGPKYLTQGHNFNGKSHTYDPVTLGLFNDSAEAEFEISDNLGSDHK